VTHYLLDTTVLVAHLRGDEEISQLMLDLVAAGHLLCVSCVNVAEVERGIRPKERRAATTLLDRLTFLSTTVEAAIRAGRYLAELSERGRTLHLADALVAATARVHGAVLVTDNVADFPMRDIRVMRPTRDGLAP
jgi:hypothetical protein